MTCKYCKRDKYLKFGDACADCYHVHNDRDRLKARYPDEKLRSRVIELAQEFRK